MMNYLGNNVAPYLADILYQHGITHAVISPGSRNAPLILSFKRHGEFNCLSVVDERSAGYFALGLAQSTKSPVALICTSGTAALNYAPAIAEAYYLNVPLMVVTADRPKHWIGQKNGQAINQDNLYANIIAKSYNLSATSGENDAVWFAGRQINEACHYLKRTSRPVHINVPFEEPLYDKDYARVKAGVITSHQTNAGSCHWNSILSPKDKVLLVVGQSKPTDELFKIIGDIAAKKNVVVLAENIANVNDTNVINNPTECLDATSVPDRIIYVGGEVVSKRLKKHLTDLKVPVIRIQEEEEIVDTFKGSTDIIYGSALTCLMNLNEFLVDREDGQNFVEGWKMVSQAVEEKASSFISQCRYSDLSVINFAASGIPESAVVHLGNSTPIRYSQMVQSSFKQGIEFYGNRGTAGIDGSVSTAVGFCYGSDKLNVLFIGDLSFQYDSNAFFNQHLKGNLKVIILNNGGGNIFRLIDGPARQPELEELIETKLDHQFKNLCEHFSLNYFSANSLEEIADKWDQFISIESTQPSVLEVFTDAKINTEVFNEFYQRLH